MAIVSFSEESPLKVSCLTAIFRNFNGSTLSSQVLSDKPSSKIYDGGLPSILVSWCFLQIPSVSARSQHIFLSCYLELFFRLNPLFLHLPKVETPPAQIPELEGCLDLLKICPPPWISYLKFICFQCEHALCLGCTAWLCQQPLPFLNSHLSHFCLPIHE